MTTGLVLSHGKRYLAQQVGVSVVVDSVTVVLLIIYLLSVRR